MGARRTDRLDAIAAEINAAGGSARSRALDVTELARTWRPSWPSRKRNSAALMCREQCRRDAALAAGGAERSMNGTR